MKVTVITELSCIAESGYIDLPIKSWDEIKNWYVKWDTLHYTLDKPNTLFEQKWYKVALNSSIEDGIDGKYPMTTRVLNSENCDEIDRQES